MRWDDGENELARMRLALAVESWHCGLAQNLEVFKAEADFASDCMYKPIVWWDSSQKKSKICTKEAQEG
jgi:hypothetical protein